MFLELVSAGILVAQYIYHRLNEDTGRITPKAQIDFPVTKEGTAYPMLFGRTLVRTPLNRWAGNRIARETEFGTVYSVDFTLVIGIPFSTGNCRLRNLYAGDEPFATTFLPSSQSSKDGFDIGTWLVPPTTDTGVAQQAPFVRSLIGQGTDGYFGFYWEFGGGDRYQDLTGSTLEDNMVRNGTRSDEVPWYRGYAVLHGYWPHTGFEQMTARTNPPTVSIEIATYPAHEALVQPKVGEDCNPADVILDLLRGRPGKMPASLDWIDYDSFRAVAQTLHSEGHGYSGALVGTCEELIADVLKQVDGVLRENPATGKVELKLVRPDYNVSALRRITPDNCQALESFALGSWTGIPNKIRVTFTNRSDGYREGSATAQDMANAVGQDGIVREEVINFPGCHTQALADELAGRELAARSRPVMKCRALVDRSFRSLSVGDVVSLTWPEYNIANIVMRIGDVSRGGPDSNTIALDLIQEYFYVRAGQPIVPPVAPFPGTAERPSVG